jgi:hypothetical protein
MVNSIRGQAFFRRLQEVLAHLPEVQPQAAKGGKNGAQGAPKERKKHCTEIPDPIGMTVVLRLEPSMVRGTLLDFCL